ncbi:homoserine-O-transacetylase [Tricharina praecox]|uniref:homoserine-O-transacetylase n=1 Tax=Tricharina praecox TaxID=43433 RepID=UPI0022201B93|nr:homoserine-O-transacetylase [Tricharina praecox]KAI5856443.1 homoserine-O-transacetylase [Tricharina praecox]
MTASKTTITNRSLAPGRCPTPQYETVTKQPENPFFSLIAGQRIAIIPEFTLESGESLSNVPVAYKTWGRLNDAGDNVMVICHALSGSADVADWWGPLIGNGKAFDTSRFFVICFNTLGSPYGSASPVTIDPHTGNYYGPEFPLCTIRDDVNIHQLVLQDLGVKQVAIVIGGSMGGMQVLEWAYFGKDYVRAIVPLATSARHSAWCISWGEAQRQSISVDPKYDDGYYPFDDPPVTGLGAARMSALLTYRSRNSFESRFGRNTPDPKRHPYVNTHLEARRNPCTPSEEHWSIHTDGFKNTRKLSSRRTSVTSSPTTASPTTETAPEIPKESTPPSSSNGNPPANPETPKESTPPSTSNGHRPTNGSRRSSLSGHGNGRANHYFSAQTYLRYQGDKFVKRFDANCYIAITRKLDTHDVSRGRVENNDIHAALRLIEQPTLVIGIESDGLFTYAEQQELAECIPNARLATIDSPEGHDAFLLQFEEVNSHILGFLKEVLPDIMEKPGSELHSVVEVDEEEGVVKASVGEVDDITAW